MDEAGQFFLEVLIGVAVIAVAVAGISAAVVVALHGSENNIKRTNQAMLLEETFEAVSAITGGNWNDLYKPLGSSSKPSADLGVRKNIAVTSACDLVGKCWEFYSVSAPAYDEIALSGVTYSRRIIIENVNRDGQFGFGTLGGSNDDPLTQRVTVYVEAPGLVEISQARFYTRNAANFIHSDTWSVTGPTTIESTTLDTGAESSFITVKWERTL